MKKKILTLQQLVKFCEKNNLLAFNSKTTGYSLSVQIPAEFSGEVTSDKGMLYAPIRICHTNLNRNGSFISEENMKRAMPSLKYRPFLAHIHQLDSGEWDFHSHDIEIVETEDGEYGYEYIEKQIGCITADEPYLQYDKEMDKTYVQGVVAIPEEYTKGAEIIRRKNGSKVSCELTIEFMEYNAKERYLDLIDFYFSGVTGLGAEKDGTEIGEGMLGSRISLEDFSSQNNSMFSNIENTKMIELLESINSKLDSISNFNITQADNSADETFKEGGHKLDKLKELLTIYNKEETDITFDVEGLSEIELEAKFKEMFEEPASDEGEESVEKDDNFEEIETEEIVEETETTDTETTEDTTESTEVVNTEVVDTENDESITEEFSKKPMIRAFEISHDDIRYALYNLISIYEEQDNDYYFIPEVFDDWFVMEGWSGSLYGHKYSVENDNVALDGERYKLYREYLTESQKAALDEMKANYSSISEQLSKYQTAELNTQKDAILYDEKYSVLSKKDENQEYVNKDFERLVSKKDNYSLTDLEKELKTIFADYITNGGQFNFNGESEKQNNVNKKTFAIPTEKKKSGRYGNLFK